MVWYQSIIPTNFVNLFPSFHTSYKVSEIFSMQAGYSRRIFRPRLWDLNPFFNIRNNFNVRTGKVEWSADLPGNGQATPMSYLSEETSRQYIVATVPNPSWRYPRDPANGTYTDSRSIKDGQGGYVIAYALPEGE